MIAQIILEFPWGWQMGIPLTLLLIALMGIHLKRQKISLPRITTLLTLRGLALILLVILISRPVSIRKETRNSSKPYLVLLFDRSESMSIQENGKKRYQQMVDFTRKDLLPALQSTGWSIKPYLFDQTVEPTQGESIVSARPNGKATNLSGAIHNVLANHITPPAAIITLTDGIANCPSENNAALSSLLEMKTPFIGIGFGSDQEVKSITLHQLMAPSQVPPNRDFKISAQLEMMNVDDIQSFDLVLIKDGKFLEKKTIQPGKGSRFWMENFSVTEPNEGVENYSVQLLPPEVPGLLTVNTSASTAVRISNEKELRVLFVQGALTWDYKFINLALNNDPGIKITGLTRTSSQSIFRQNVENAGELNSGFPNTLEAMAPFRVVILSNLKPTDLSPLQQELLGRFCGELGGGILMMGGPDTFNASWQGSRLEQLLPVVFSSDAGVRGLDQPFHLQLTDEALQQTIFQIQDTGSSRSIWEQLPPLKHYGRVDSAKPGAEIWGIHSQDVGPHGPRILIANQRYGAGLSMAICFQNLWRWRLAKDSDPSFHDRFWKQLFRYLGEISRTEVAINFPDQDLTPQSDIHFELEKQPDPKNAAATTDSESFSVLVRNSEKKTILKQDHLELKIGQPVDLSFLAKTGGIYSIQVQNSKNEIAATRSIEIKNLNIEFQKTARSMETLSQWASLSNGLAVKVEDCGNSAELVQQIRDKVEQALKTHNPRTPFGIHPGVLAVLLGCLAGEWILKKQWDLI